MRLSHSLAAFVGCLSIAASVAAQGRAPYQSAIDISLAFTILVSVRLALGLLAFQPGQQAARAAHRLLVRLHPFAALCAAAALSLPNPGVVALLIGLPWVLFCAGTAGLGLLRLGTFRGQFRLWERGGDLACAYLLVGGTWLFATLLGVPFLGFKEPIVRLTAVHFHVASFCLILISLDLASRAVALGRWGSRAMLCALAVHLASPAVVAIGITFSRPVEVVGAASLVLSWAAIVGLCWRGGAVSWLSGRSRALLIVSFSCLLLTLSLALSYSLWRSPVIPKMALVHGLLNALVVVPTALLALAWSPGPVPCGDDRELLALWERVPISGRGWAIIPLRHDRLEIQIPAASLEPGGFERAGEMLLSYRVYPDSLLDSTSRFREEGRRARPGDRIAQRAHLLHLKGHLALSLPSMVEVQDTVDDASCKALAYVTTVRHVGVGRWSSRIERTKDGACRIVIESWSRPRGVLLFSWPVFRFFQMRARAAAVKRLSEALTAA